MTKSHSHTLLVFHCRISTWNCDQIRSLERISRNMFLLLSLSALTTVISYSQPVLCLHLTHGYILEHMYIHSLRLEHKFMFNILRAKHNLFHFSRLQINQVENQRGNADMNKLFQMTPFTIFPVLLHQECANTIG